MRKFMYLLLGLVASITLTMPALAGPPQPATDEQIAQIIKDSGKSKDYGDADLVYLLDEADIYVRSTGLATTESRQLIKVLTDKGVKSQSVLRWEFDPDTYRLNIDTVRIHRKDGTIDEIDLSSLITPPSKQHMIYWGGQEHLLSLPRVRIGDVLDIRINKTGFNIAYLADAAGGTGSAGSGEETLVPPMPGHWYEVTLFQGKYPIETKRYSVHMPKDMPIQFEVFNGNLRSSLWFEEEYNVYTWEATKVPAVKREPHMVALDDSVPKLVIATLEDWESKSRWFYEVNEGQFDADDDIRAKVREITRGLKTKEEKVAAVVHWVADNIRYYGTKRGPCEGFTLHRSIETFRDRGGVCKDKAGMAVTMLRELDLEAYAALTMAGSRVEDIPADQFNHTVTVIRHDDGQFQVLDPTWVPLSRDLWSSQEQLQGLVYGTAKGESLTLSPYYEPDYNKRAVRSNGEIREDGTLTTNLTFNLKGAAGGRFRRSIHGISIPQRRAAIERVLNIAPNATVDSFDYTNPHDYSRDAEVKIAVTAEGFAAGGNGLRAFRMPLMTHPLNGFFRAAFLDKLKKKKRNYDMYLWATRMISYQETLKLPPGWVVTNMPKAKAIDTPIASLTFEGSAEDGKLTYRFELAMKKGTITVADYGDFKRAIDAMYELADTWLVCTTGESTTELAKQANANETDRGVRHE